MIFQVYAYRDRVTKAYSRPILELDSTENYVERMTRAFMTEDELHHVKSKDLVLYHLGSYDDKKACFVLNKEPEFLMSVDDIEWKGVRDNANMQIPTDEETVQG